MMTMVVACQSSHFRVSFHIAIVQEEKHKEKTSKKRKNLATVGSGIPMLLTGQDLPSHLTVLGNGGSETVFVPKSRLTYCAVDSSCQEVCN